MIQPSDANRSRASEIYIKNREAGNIAVPSLSTSLFDPEKACSYRIVSLKARARNVKPKINTAMHVKSAGQLQRN